MWNSFNSVFYAINDNAHANELMNAPEVMTREEVNWQYELPMSLGLTRMGNLLQVNWQGGVLQQSTDLAEWSDLSDTQRPFKHTNAAAPQMFWRIRK